MKRLWSIFGIYFEDALQYRSTAFVWFLLALFNPLMVLLFWKGAFQSAGQEISGWTYQTTASYYLMVMLASTLLMSHIEGEIARRDIQLGGLSQYLMKPFPYVLHKFFGEFPWRIMQGIYAVSVLLFFIYVLHVHIHLSSDPWVLALAFVIAVLAHIMAFLFKMVLGLTALWVTDYSGLQELIEVIMIIFAGFVMPIVFFPSAMQPFVSALPFVYMIYIPIISFLGQLSYGGLWWAVAGELFWLGVFYNLYRFMWVRGVKKFTGLGQ